MSSVNRDTLFQSFLFLLAEHLLLFPISFALLTLTGVDKAFSLYGVVLISACALMLMRAKLKIRRSILVLAFLCVFLSFCFIWSHMNWMAMIIIASVGIYTEIRALFLVERPYSGTSFYVCICIGIFGYLFSKLYDQIDKLKPHAGLLGLFATLAVVFTCICMNLSLTGYEKTVSNRINGIPSASKKSNRVILTTFILLILILSGLGFADRIYAFIRSAVRALISLILFLLRRPAPTESAPTGEESPLFPVPEGGSPSAFWVVFEKIVMVLACILLIIGCIFLLRYIARYVAKHYRKAIQWIRDRLRSLLERFLHGKGYTERADLGYEDECTSLVKNNKTLLAQAGRWLKYRTREGRPYILLTDNTQRARWLYSHIVGKAVDRGMDINRTMTPGQVLYRTSRTEKTEELDEAVKTYNQARYGNTSPENKGVEAMKRIYRKP